jgi:excisionase family DNA binding protein
MKNVGNDSAFLTIQEFADCVNIHHNTVRRMIKSGRISALQLGSGKKTVYRIPKSEIDRIAICNMESVINRIIEKRLNDKSDIIEEKDQ